MICRHCGRRLASRGLLSSSNLGDTVQHSLRYISKMRAESNRLYISLKAFNFHINITIDFFKRGRKLRTCLYIFFVESIFPDHQICQTHRWRKLSTGAD